MKDLLSNNIDSQFYSILFKNNFSIMLLIDFKTMKIVDANYAACAFYKYSYQEFLKLSLTDLSTLRSDQIYDQLNLIASNVKKDFTFNHRISTGEIKNVRINSGLIKIDNKIYILSIIFDNTNAEGSAQDAQRQKSDLMKESTNLKDNFITMVTHEFKTPIAVINAAVQTMEIVCKDDITQRMRNYLDKIKQNSLRQQRLVDNLLDITRLKAGRMKANFNNIEILSLTKEIIESIRPYAKQKQLDLTLQSICESIIISTDIEKYVRIILNLLSNAIKFTPPNNTISVIINTFGSNLKVEVQDQGIGIPENKRSKVFERFEQADTSFSRQAEGTGIGLYLVKLLADNIGGSIELKSKEGIGSTFSVILPLQQDSSCDYRAINKKEIHLAASREFSDVIL